MRVAVIGGGTAGFMAAAHITKHFPEFTLSHIYDSSIPTIGVGEGTAPRFPTWISETTGVRYEELVERCHVTRKFGIRFENWGTAHREFVHNFYPAGRQFAYHISAPELLPLLAEHVTAERIDKKVIGLQSDGISSEIGFADGSSMEVDFAVDAKGFPREIDDFHAQLSAIPTNAALIRRGGAIENQTATRAVARKHGWIFVIPLTSHTSYGYVFNNSVNDVAEIEADLNQFLDEEFVTPVKGHRVLTFPNFTRRTYFDGSLFRMGNVASFLEPLEATAINAILRQILLFCFWPLERLRRVNRRGPLDAKSLARLNALLFRFAQEMSLFVSWHYAKGSRFDTEFWRHAKKAFRDACVRFQNDPVLKSSYVAFQEGLAQVRDVPHLSSNQNLKFACNEWPSASFHAIGHGIGYFKRH